MSYCQSSTQGWMDICCISSTIHSFWDDQELVWLQYGKPVQLHTLAWTLPPYRRLSPGFSLGMHNFQFCTVKAPQNVRRGLCCLPVGNNLITAHGASRVSSCLPGWTSLATAGDPEHPSVLRPSPTSKLTRPWWIFSAAGQALKDVWLTVSWDVPDSPTALWHLEAALHSLLTSQFSPWFP